MARISNYIIQYVNLLTLLLSLAVLGLGAYLAIQSTHHHACDKFLTVPVLAVGGFILLISLVGFVGAWRSMPVLLWIYLIVMFFLLVAMAAFTVFAFVVTNGGAGHAVSGQGYKEYKLGDYSHFLRKQLSNPKYWKHLRSCLVKTQYCDDLATEYKTLKAYKKAELTPIQAGCCRPPSECGFAARNASYYDLASRPSKSSSSSSSRPSSNPDCKAYKNAPSTRCYDCDSCKAGVAQYIKKKWRIIAIFNIAAVGFLIILYCVGCCARRNATYASHDKSWD